MMRQLILNPENQSDEQPPKPFSHKGHKYSTQLGQVRFLQKKLCSLANNPKVTANSLAQIAKAWSSLEEHRSRLSKARPNSKQSLAEASKVALSTPTPPGQFAFVESLPDELADDARGLVQTRKPPEGGAPRKRGRPPKNKEAPYEQPDKALQIEQEEQPDEETGDE